MGGGGHGVVIVLWPLLIIAVGLHEHAGAHVLLV